MVYINVTIKGKIDSKELWLANYIKSDEYKEIYGKEQ